jgi:small multidrug resistance pump
MWLWLGIAIVSEVCGTLALRVSDGFTRALPVACVLVGYVIAFYALSQALARGMSLGAAYAIWAGAGTAAIAVLGIWLFDDVLTTVQAAGLALIVVGIVVAQWGAAH